MSRSAAAASRGVKDTAAPCSLCCRGLWQGQNVNRASSRRHVARGEPTSGPRLHRCCRRAGATHMLPRSANLCDSGEVPGPEKTLRSIEEMCAAGLLRSHDAQALQSVAARYAVAITPDIVALIDCADCDDPIARQFLPDPHELQHSPVESAYPL